MPASNPESNPQRIYRLCLSKPGKIFNYDLIAETLWIPRSDVATTCTAMLRSPKIYVGFEIVKLKPGRVPIDNHGVTKRKAQRRGVRVILPE